MAPEHAPLCVAARLGQFYIIDRLLAAGASVRHSRGHVLHYSCLHCTDDLQTMRTLLKAGAPLEHDTQRISGSKKCSAYPTALLMSAACVHDGMTSPCASSNSSAPAGARLLLMRS